MKRILFMLISATLFTQFSFGQNLVPNPSFEVHDSCPDGPSELKHAASWFQPTRGTPDYFHECALYPAVRIPQNFAGFQNAHSGIGCAGFFALIFFYDSLFPNYREYCEVKLNTPLKADTTYFVTFFVSLADSMNYGTDAIAAYFSNDTIKNDTGYFLPSILPQVENNIGNFLVDKMSWTKISGKYIALGGEEFLTIGNFKDRTNTDTLFLADGSSNTGQSDYLGGYYYLDDVCVSTDSVFAHSWTNIESITKKSILQLYPNPANGHLEVMNSIGNCNYSIVNILGEKVQEGVFVGIYDSIDISSIPDGVYLFTVNESYFVKFCIYH